MSRLADPSLCPDCRAAVQPDATCSACGLVLRGPLADHLWQTMLTADGLVEQLRVAGVAPAPSASTSAPGGSVAPLPPPIPVPPQQPAAGTSPLPSRTVPALLLTVGGLLVFVAVSLFLAVTWTILPLGLKALLMAGFTVAVSAGAYLLSRRGLRGSAEAIWALAGSTLVLDISAAYRAGLFGLDAASARGITIGGGLLVIGFAVVGILAVRRTRLAHSYALEVVLVLAGFAVSLAVFWTGLGSDGPAQIVGVLLLTGASLALRRIATGLAVWGVAALATLTWIDLAALGLVKGLEAGSRSDFWHGFDGWPLLAAAVLAGVVAGVNRVPALGRTVAAGAALVTLLLPALLPPADGTVDVVAASLVVAVLAGLAVLSAVPDAWRTAARYLAGVGAGGGILTLAVATVGAGVAFASDRSSWRTPVAQAFDDAFPSIDAAGWTLLLVLAATALAVLAVVPGHRQLVVALLPTVVAATIAGTLGHSSAPAWSVGVALALAAVLAAVPGLTARDTTAPVAIGLCGVLLLTAVAVLTRLELLAPEPGSLVVTALACAVLLAAAYVARRPVVRVVIEGYGAALGLLALAVTPPHAAQIAMVLTLLGSAVVLVSVLRADRWALGWVGSAVLTAGTFVRLVDSSDVGPELYALPAAALLLAVGVRRLLREPALGTWRILGSGLSLALLPSAALALADPGSLRTALVVVGAAIALGVGLERKWQAPFLYGAGVLTLIALRFLLPLAGDVLANPLGAWLLFGAAGSACLTAGVLWEQSVRNLRTASRFVGSLR